jgi:outer membrane protein assembly factor BamB
MAPLHRVELVPDDEPAPGGRGTPAEGAPGRAAPARRRTLLARVGAPLLALAVALGAVGSWRASTAEQARLANPGAVRSLAVPPTPAWSADAATPRVAVVDDVVVTVTAAGVEGRDAASGARRWLALDATATCGPTPDESAGPVTDVLVCVTGPALAPVAHVVGPDGPVTGPVPLGDTLGRAVPAPDGTVLRWARTGGVVHLALQDARTARVRWRHDVPPDDAERTPMCRPQVAGQAAATVEDGLLVVRGCRVSAVLTAAGTRLDAPGPAVTTDVVPLPDGTFLRTRVLPPGREATTELVTPDAAVLAAVDGRLLRPLVGPEDDAAPWLVATADGVRALAAADGSGDGLRERWRLAQPVAQVVALAADRAVVVTGERVVALDARSGEPVWSWPRSSPAGRPAAPGVGTAPAGTTTTADDGPGTTGVRVDLTRGVAAAFTDGATLALVVPDGSSRRSRTVALSLEDGDVRWDVVGDGDPSGFTALAGYVGQVDAGSSRVVVLERRPRGRSRPRARGRGGREPVGRPALPSGPPDRGEGGRGAEA